jgi:hypothetical protein
MMEYKYVRFESWGFDEVNYNVTTISGEYVLAHINYDKEHSCYLFNTEEDLKLSELSEIVHFMNQLEKE